PATAATLVPVSARERPPPVDARAPAAGAHHPGGEPGGANAVENQCDGSVDRRYECMLLHARTSHDATAEDMADCDDFGPLSTPVAPSTIPPNTVGAEAEYPGSHGRRRRLPSTTVAVGRPPDFHNSAEQRPT